MDVNWQNITEVGSHAAKRNAIQVWGLSAHRVHGSSPQAGEAEGSEAARAWCGTRGIIRRAVRDWILRGHHPRGTLALMTQADS